MYKVYETTKTQDVVFSSSLVEELSLDQELALNYDKIDLDLSLLHCDNGVFYYSGEPIYIETKELKEELVERLDKFRSIQLQF